MLLIFTHIYFKKEVHAASTKTNAVTGTKVVSYAKKFVGNPYRYGGTSLTKGTDCSGFTPECIQTFWI